MKQIDSKQKRLNREEEDAQADFGALQSEIIQRVLRKLIPTIDKYAQDNGLAFIIDGSKPWPEWPLVWASPKVDITKAVVEAYNVSYAGAGSISQPSSPSNRN
jgi:Skp family chaperone for outer membrane proteins